MVNAPEPKGKAEKVATYCEIIGGVSGLLALLVGLQDGARAWLSVWWEVLVLGGAGMLSMIALAEMLGWRRGLRDVIDRWNGPDLKDRGALSKVTLLLGGVCLRWSVRLGLKWQLWVSAALIALIGARTVAVWYLHPKVSATTGLSASMLPSYMWFFGTTSVLVLSAVYGAAAFIEQRRSLYPKNRIKAEIFRVIREYSEKEGDAQRLRRAVLTQDIGPIRVMAINGGEFLQGDALSPNSVLAEAMAGAPEKTFAWLAGDPTGTPLFLRNALLNHRFREFYAIPFLKLLLLWQKEQRAAGVGRSCIKVRLFTGFPQYKMVLSPHRAVAQRYGAFRPGRDEPPVVLHCVLRRRDLNALPLPAAGPLEIADPPASLYKHFSDVFDQQWSRGEEIGVLETWPAAKLQKLARRCRLPRRSVLDCGEDSVALAHEIYRELRLEQAWDDARR